MDERSRELLDRVRAVVEERNALLHERAEWKERVERDAYLAEQAGRETAERERDALRTDVERLRALPVIATCGACGYESPAADAAGDVCNVCTHSGPNQWQPVRADKAPPTWCPLRGAR